MVGSRFLTVGVEFIDKQTELSDFWGHTSFKCWRQVLRPDALGSRTHNISKILSFAYAKIFFSLLGFYNFSILDREGFRLTNCSTQFKSTPTWSCGRKIFISKKRTWLTTQWLLQDAMRKWQNYRLLSEMLWKHIRYEYIGVDLSMNN